MKISRSAFVLLLVSLASAALAADPVKVEDRVQLADGLFRRGMFELAAREYAELASLKGVGGKDVVLFRLGECYRRTGKEEIAEAAYVRLINLFPKSAYADRARLQSALIQLAKGGGSLEQAAKSFAVLAQADRPDDVRSASLFYLGETLEKLQKDTEALQVYEGLAKEYGATQYGMFAGLKTAYLLARSEKKEDRKRAMGIYLDLIPKAKNPKVQEEATYLAAQLALVEQNYAQCARLFRQLKQNFPQSPRVKESAVSAAWAGFFTGQYKEASAILQLVVNDKDYPRREEVLYLKANCFRQLEQGREAVAWYTKQLAEFPDGAFAEKGWNEQLNTCYHGGDYSNTLAMVKARVKLPAERIDRTYWIASDAALAIGQEDVSVEYAKRLVAQCPESPLLKDALYRLGWLLQKQQAWEAAAQWYLKIHERFPKDPVASKALYASGVCHSQLQQRDLALRDWTQLLTHYPQSEEAPEALYQKAMEELRGEAYRAAGATLDERLKRYPDDNRKADVLYWRAVAYRKLNDFTEATKKFRDCLAAGPTKEIERETILQLGLLLYQQDKKDEAAKFFLKLLDAPFAQKMGVERLAWLASFELSQKAYEPALAAANALIGLKPDAGWLQTGWALAGNIHLARGERDAAAEAYREALKTGAATTYAAESALNLGRLLTERGEFEEARQFLADAAARAVSPEMIGIRARAYAALAENAEKKGDEETALRYHMSVGILFDDKELVPASILASVRLLEKLGRPDEAVKLRDELDERYPGYAKTRGGGK
ncbi:MAG: tetratricopeptide repeat protein [Kiritimatiellae bacterium]|nr:tetratricopeptide repeat protein [Kiritimatiellia bacterium]